MKKLFVILLTSLLMFSFVSCELPKAETVTVTIKVTGAKDQTETVEKGSTYTLPSTPEVDGHFQGWLVDESEETKEAGSTIILDANTTLTAKIEEHSWVEGNVTKQPTCTEEGEKTYTCSVCHNTKTEPVEALGHSWDEGNVTKQPTCTEEGEKTYTCSVCHNTKTEPVEALGHSWDEGNVTKQPTCTEEGEKTYTCSVCHNTKTEPVEALGHNIIDTDTGKCSRCGKFIVDDYAKLSAAILTGNANIVLTEDITSEEDLIIKDGQILTIDLNGHNIVFEGQNSFCIYGDGDNQGAKLSLLGEGSVSSTDAWLFYIIGATEENDASECYLSVGKDVTLDAQNAISVQPAKNASSSYGVTIDVFGTVKGYQPIYVSGNIKNDDEKAAKINIHDDAIIESKEDTGIYIAGYSRVVMGKNAKISSESGNAIAIAAGELEINGAILTAGNEFIQGVSEGGSLAIDCSSAVVVMQHTTNLPLKVVINSGSFTGYLPFSQAKGGATTPQPEKVEIKINGGEFNCTNTESNKTVKSYNKTGFITGGTFNIEPDSTYIAEGYKAEADGDSFKIVKNTKSVE